MNQPAAEIETNMSQDNRLLEGVFKVVWEKTRATSDLVRQLREEKRDLSHRVAELDTLVQKLQGACTRQEQELKKLRAEHEEMMSSNGGNALSADEKERLKNKVRDLIAKINSYL